jgi:hypothetical protein
MSKCMDLIYMEDLVKDAQEKKWWLPWEFEVRNVFIFIM